ncbi:BMP family ABC transporter substrate-binding protein [Paracoccus sp. MBLB3053]|uniref:BMP family ABC transporter substrate-binding protein n=1 Tax=Paracoccus aurantius TaxID=3073814 RepID=A0ABU2HS47_9RHOB|nr:BMP family ABC transporter substrate-binding protein [Paracoccus sp. MBLB3053]MDS9467862.1 BMP family ABC transporter substrate-binding protein [Paracoccus sp. MBLB3053]
MSQNRRQFLTTGAALAGAAALGLPKMARADEPLGVALIAPSPNGDVGWTHALASGLEKAKAEIATPINITVLDNIMEGPDADRIMQKTVADGNKLVLAGSFGYQNGALQLARRFPDVTVIHASGYQVAPNFSNFAAKNFEGTYLMGMAAAAVTKSKKLGSVSAFAIPELITSINAFALGARAIDPEIEVSVVWVNSWFDPAKEQSAAKALISQGVDVIFSNAQDTPSVIAACEEAGVYAFNLNSSMKSYAPKTYLGCVETDWAPYFKAEIEAHLAGEFKGSSHWLGISEGVIKVSDWNADIPADAMTRIEEARAKMADGSFNPFTGPIVKADGTEVAAAGAIIPDDQVLAMDYHVQGVVTPLPK